MTTIVTRAGKGSALTHNELDTNFTNLNTDKVEASGDSMTGDLSFGDNVKAKFGAGDDLQIYHTGSASFVKDAGTGNLNICGTDINFLTGDESEYLATFATNGGCLLRYDNALKLATTSTGVNVTGTLTADGLTVDGVSGNMASFNGTLGNVTINADGAALSFTRPSASYIRASDASGSLYLDTGGSTRSVTISANKDVSFYEDTGTTAKLFWDASAESLGIGTTSPDAVLEVDGSASTDGILITNPLSGSFYNAKVEFRRDSTLGGAKIQTERNSAGGVGLSFNVTADNTAELNGTYSQAMTLDRSGNLLFSNADTVIGTNTSDSADTGAIYLCGGGNQTVGRGANIRVHGNEDTPAGDVYIYSGNVAGSDILLSAYSSTSTIQFATNNTEAARFDSSGNLLIGYTSSNGAYKLQVNSQIFATSATIATSDGRYKENVVPLSGALDLVAQLNPVQFDWKEHPVHNFDRDSSTVGFIAQEVQSVLADKPYLNSIVKRNECVIEPQETDDDGNVIKDAVTEEFFGIAEGNMVALLTKAIQELKAEFDAYKEAHP